MAWIAPVRFCGPELDVRGAGSVSAEHREADTQARVQIFDVLSAGRLHFEAPLQHPTQEEAVVDEGKDRRRNDQEREERLDEEPLEVAAEERRQRAEEERGPREAERGVLMIPVLGCWSVSLDMGVLFTPLVYR